MADWSSLPRDLLLVVAKRLETHFDVLHLRAVCPTWRAAVPLDLLRPPTFCLPINGLKLAGRTKSLMIKRTVCLLKFSAKHSQIAARFWMVMLEEDEFGRKCILHPLLKCKLKPVQYPEVLDLSKFHIQEIGREYFARVTYYHIGCIMDQVAYLMDNPYDEKKFIFLGEDDIDVGYLRYWHDKPTAVEVEGWGYCVDIVKFKCNYYAVDNFGKTVYVESWSGAWFPVARASAIRGADNFLVEFCGSLLLVERTGEYTPSCSMSSTFRFKVFKLDEERSRWDCLESLGDGILFLGGFCKFSAPAVLGVEGNCIVFNLSTSVAKREIGTMPPVEKAFVFHLSTGVTVPLARRRDLLQLFLPSFV